jgi:two-component system NtrC family sensor kinase
MIMRAFSFSANASLTGKLVVAVSAFFAIGSLVFWLIVQKKEQQGLLNYSVDFVAASSEVVTKSLRHDMLNANMKDIQPTLDSIVGSRSVVGVRILNGKGEVAYSTNRTGAGQELRSGEEFCRKCHNYNDGHNESQAETKRWVIDEHKGQRILTYAAPIANEPECYSAACHVHREDEKLLGLLLTDFSLQGIDTGMQEQQRNTLVYLISSVLMIAVVLSLILWFLVIKPLTALSDGMAKVGDGDLTHKLPVPSRDELGQLAESFNTMTEELQGAREKMAQWTKSLEEEVRKKTIEIQKTQEKLFQAEKLAALGRFTADIAHEIRNPLTALGGFGRRLQKLVSTEKEKNYAGIIVSESDRLERILRDVMTFSRDTEYVLERVPLTDVVHNAVYLFQEMCDDQKIQTELSMTCELPVLIDRDQFHQALVNILANAVDAMPSGGILSVSLHEASLNALRYVVVEVADTGPGIPETQLSYIYEPFFTTKKIGPGTGLGLAISRKIMEEHAGLIKAENRPGGGLVVSLFLPYQEEGSPEQPCWEYMHCGREENKESPCPAYPHFGRACWAVGGTLCQGKVQGTFAQKITDCRECSFFRHVNGSPAQGGKS